MITTFQNTTFADVDGGVQIEHKVVNSRGGFKEVKMCGKRETVWTKIQAIKLYFFAIWVVVNSLTKLIYRLYVELFDTV